MMMMMLFPVLGLLLIGGIVVAVLVGGILLHRQGGRIRPAGPESQPSARQSLDARLARGDISLEEYETRRQIES